MKLNIKLDENLIQEGLFFIRRHLKNIKVGSIDKINIKWGSENYYNAYGICWYPYKKKGYRISLFLPKNDPGYVLTRGNYHKEKKRTYTHFKDANESLVWVYGHEIFHYLSHSKQRVQPNTEINADRYGDRMLARYRRYMQEKNQNSQTV